MYSLCGYVSTLVPPLPPVPPIYPVYPVPPVPPVPHLPTIPSVQHLPPVPPVPPPVSTPLPYSHHSKAWPAAAHKYLDAKSLLLNDGQW